MLVIDPHLNRIFPDIRTTMLSAWKIATAKDTIHRRLSLAFLSIPVFAHAIITVLAFGTLFSAE
jgi:ABC-type dipeptide/oligopeptide/nickel transport system permease component